MHDITAKTSTSSTTIKPQLLPARVQPAAISVPQLRQRRFPRAGGRHHRALAHAGIPRQARPHQKAPDPQDLGLLLKSALDGRVPAHWPADRSVALEGLSGQITPEQYNRAWWALRLKIGASRRTRPRQKLFDAGAKYHVPANVPYTRYFWPILSVPFHRRSAKPRAAKTRSTAAPSTRTRPGNV